MLTLTRTEDLFLFNDPQSFPAAERESVFHLLAAPFGCRHHYQSIFTKQRRLPIKSKGKHGSATIKFGNLCYEIAQFHA